MGNTNAVSDALSRDVAVSMKTTTRDKSSSFMFAIIALFGLGVILLTALFMLRLAWPTPAEPLLSYIQTPQGTLNPPGIARDSDPLQIEVDDANDAGLAESLSNAGLLVSGALSIGGNKSGLGDPRQPGPPGEGPDAVPDSQRWELRFSGRDLNSYAKTLDYFDIELAAVGGGEALVQYASDFSSSSQTRSAAGDQEKRLYFLYRNEGTLLQYDRQLLNKAGIKTENRIVLKFVPSELQSELQRIELDYARKHHGEQTTLSDIAKTIYECKSNGDQSFQWIVVDQRYRKPVSSDVNQIDRVKF